MPIGDPAHRRAAHVTATEQDAHKRATYPPTIRTGRRPASSRRSAEGRRLQFRALDAFDLSSKSDLMYM